MGERKVHTGCRWGNLRDGDHLEDLGVDGGMEWIYLAQDRDRQGLIVNSVMNLGLHKMWIIS
jgi:hypothetical protein